jgi:hypothetical protein
MSMGVELPMRRRDEEGDFHDVLYGICPDCGCRFLYATDDPDVVWEPERSWDPECSDRECHCHTAPIIGVRRG